MAYHKPLKAILGSLNNVSDAQANAVTKQDITDLLAPIGSRIESVENAFAKLNGDVRKLKQEIEEGEKYLKDDLGAFKKNWRGRCRTSMTG